MKGKMPRLTVARRVQSVKPFPPTLPLYGLRTQILIVKSVVSPEEVSGVTGLSNSGRFRGADLAPNQTVLSVILGSLLGDGGFYEQFGSKSAGQRSITPSAKKHAETW